MRTVSPFQQRKHHADLRGLPLRLLKVPCQQQVEALVGAPELHVCLNLHRVLGLGQRIKKLMNADGLARLVALLEVVPLKHLRHSLLGRELNDITEGHLVEPRGVVPDLRLLGIEHAGGLVVVRLSVLARLFKGKLRARLGAAGRVADHARKVTHDENGPVPKVLELPQLPQHNGVAEVQVGAARVAAQLYGERGFGFSGGSKLVGKLIVRNDFLHPAAEDRQLLVDGREGHVLKFLVGG